MLRVALVAGFYENFLIDLINNNASFVGYLADWLARAGCSIKNGAIADLLRYHGRLNDD